MNIKLEPCNYSMQSIKTTSLIYYSCMFWNYMLDSSQCSITQNAFCAIHSEYAATCRICKSCAYSFVFVCKCKSYLDVSCWRTRLFCATECDRIYARQLPLTIVILADKRSGYKSNKTIVQPHDTYLCSEKFIENTVVSVAQCSRKSCTNRSMVNNDGTWPRALTVLNNRRSDILHGLSCNKKWLDYRVVWLTESM